MPFSRYLRDRKTRGYAIQAVVLAIILLGGTWLILNAAENLRRAGIASGFAFLDKPAGFEISFKLIDFSARSTYGRAFFVGLTNTLLVASLGIVFATVLGFVVGVARLSRNWLLSRLAAAYIGTIRNIPLMLQLMFWYIAMLTPLPLPRNALNLADLFFLSNRGLFMPRPAPLDDFWPVAAAFVAGLALAIAYTIWTRSHWRRTGRRLPLLWPVLALIVVPAAVVRLVGGPALDFEIPKLAGFNFAGGIRIPPEFLALWLALTLYSGGFIAETVRAGINAVAHGQVEAARALGLPAGPTMRRIVIPQAMRVIIPPMTSQYLNLLKNSSLAVIVGFPDLVAVFAGSTLNQTGQSIETLSITMAVFLTISLAISALMNWYNRRVALVER